MAEVQLALQRGPAGFEKLVVVKLVHENLATQKAFVDMLLDEARIAALLKHPNVVDIYDLGEDEGRYFIAMEYLEGEPLLAVLRAGRDGQRLDVLSTARLVADTAEGLDAAHELRSMAGDPIELVHHDVSLGNIVVLYNGQVKLVDFGVAKATQSAAGRTRLQGKYSYMAPEKLRGGPGDRRSDIWSLGCVLWEALTLRRLFKGGNDGDTMLQVLDSAVLAPSAVNGDVPADFDAIALRSLERDPGKRYPTAKAMASELEDVLRKHGYAAKNDVIARYMQSTFHGHIAARKKLLQEVSSKGRASADVVAAAFNVGAIAAGSPIVSPGNQPEPCAWPAPPARGVGDGPTDVEGSPVRGGGDGPTEVGAPPVARRRRRIAIATGVGAVAVIIVAATVLLAPPPPPSVQLGGRGEPAAQPQEPAAQAPRPPPTPAAEIAPAVAVTSPATPSTEATGAGLVTAPPTPPAAVHPSDVDAQRPESPVGVGSDLAGGARGKAPRGVEVPAGRSIRSPPAHHAQAARPALATKPAPERINPEEVYKAGVQAWMAGDARTALAAYRRAVKASPGYAPAWRAMVLAHDKLGERSAAREAFQRYLQLVPAAPDAAGIRARLEAQ